MAYLVLFIVVKASHARIIVYHKNRIVAEAVLANRFFSDKALALSAYAQLVLIVTDKVQRTDKLCASQRLINAFQFIENLIYPVFVCSVFSCVSCRIYTGRTASKLY